MNSLAATLSKTRKAYNLAAQKYHDLFHNEINEMGLNVIGVDISDRCIEIARGIPTISR